MLSEWPDLWAETHRLYAEQSALDLDTHQLSYADLALEADLLQKRISKNHVIGAGTIVAVPVDRADFLIPYIACWNLGATVVPYSLCGIEDNLTIKRFVQSATDIWLDSEYSPTATERGHNRHPQIEGMQNVKPLHAIYFTSGSTGCTKGVLRGWSQAIHEARSYAGLLMLKPGYRALTLINPTFGASTKQVLGSLLSGCCQSFPRLMQGGISFKDGYVIYGTPSHFLTMDKDQFSSRFFHWVSMTGEAPNIHALEAARRLLYPNGQILNAIGGTEFGVICNQIYSESKTAASLHANLQHKCLSIHDEMGEGIHSNTPGRLRVTSDYLAEGYIEFSPGADHLTFSPFHKTTGGQSTVLTGDIATLSGDGVLKLIGRSNAMIKRNGQWLNTYPLKEQLEKAQWIERHVIDHDPTTGKMRVCIYPSADASHEQVKSECLRIRDGLLHKELRSIPFFVVPELPRNQNGKLDLLKLQDMQLDCLIDDGDDGHKVEVVVNYLLHGHSDSEMELDQITLLELGVDSMQLIEIATSVERLTGSTNKLASFLMPLPLKSLRTNLWKEFEHGSWPLQLGQADSPTVILWFGFAGIIPLRRQFGHQCQILYWDCDHSIPLDRSQCMATLESLAQHPSHAMADRKLPSRLLIGGFSFGANMAHEVTHQIESKGMKVDLTLLLDPAFFPRFRTNAPGRFIRDQCLSCLRFAISKKHHGTYLDRFTRKSIRQRALTRLRPKNINASMWIQTTEKKRKNTLRLFDHSKPGIQWAHEDTPRHLDLMTDQVLMERWINIIRKWAE